MQQLKWKIPKQITLRLYTGILQCNLELKTTKASPRENKNKAGNSEYYWEQYN